MVKVGKHKLIISEPLPGSDPSAAIAAAIAIQPEVIGIAVTDENTIIVAGEALVTFRMPFAMTLLEVRANLKTPVIGPDPIVVDINQNGVSVLSSPLRIDLGELTSVTAILPAVISNPTLIDDAQMTVDVDYIGDTAPGATGLKIWLIGRRT